MLKRIITLVLFLGIATALWFRQQLEEQSPPTQADQALKVNLSDNPAEQPPQQSSSSPPLTPVSSVSANKTVKVDSPIIRVSLTNRSRKSFQLESEHPLRVVLGSAQTNSAPQERPLEFTGKRTVKATFDGIKIGSDLFQADWIDLIPEKSPSVWVNDHQYRGKIRFHLKKRRKLLAANHLPLNEYLASVVDSEMPAAFPDEARQAQAIAARSYALYRMGKTLTHPTHHLFASTSSQKYLGFQYRSGGRRLAGESANSRQLVQATAGTICLHHDRLFCTYYSAVCGGRTSEGKLLFPDAASLLKSVPCSYCESAGLYRWQLKFDRTNASDKINRYLSRYGKSLGPLKSVKMIDSQTGTKARYLLSDGRRTHQLTAEELRSLLPGLYSSHLEFKLEKEKLVVKGKGHGHGVGFCQWGARGMALQGHTTEQILEHYYPGVKLHQIESAEEYQAAIKGDRIAPEIYRTADHQQAMR